jgi:AmmeMemoRadiSam system protein B
MYMRHQLLLLFVFLFSFSPARSQNITPPNRPPAVANQFYPGNADDLKKAINGYLARATMEKLNGSIIGLVVPHAGYVYSAPVAAYAYKQLTGKKYDVVIIIGCSHHHRYPYAAVWPSGSFRTPLGSVRVDTEVVGQLLQSPAFKADPKPHLPEHSIEVQLPFLQTALDSFAIVPLLLGFDDLPTATQVARAVAAAAKNKNVLIVASTDLSHYPAYNDANRIDRATLESWKTLDPERICAAEQKLMAAGVTEEHCTMCATSAVLVTFLAAKELGARELTVLNYANSGDATGDHGRVVGYGAAALTR